MLAHASIQPVAYRRRGALLAGLALAWFVALLTFAEPSSARAQDDDSLARAVVLFEESEQLYNDGEFAQAVALLRRAYTLHASPTLMFNLARALEGLGELDDAIQTYERYLAEAEDLPDRGAIERRVETLRGQRERLRGADAAADADAGSDGEVIEVIEVIESPAPDSGGASADPVPWVVFGLGAAAIGGAIGLGVVSQHEASAAAEERQQDRAAARHEGAETYALVANVLFAVGGAAALAGAIWGVVSLATGDGGERVEAALTPGGVLVRGRF